MEITELETQNILVISYFFPPFNRVGGRRWAKHVKYLNRFGINTFVLCGEFPNSKSPWDDDIKEYEHKITRVNLFQKKEPFFKTKLPNGFLEKIKWKISLYAWNIRKDFLKGNYEDLSLPNIDNFLRKAEAIIEQKEIATVILSVGPFSYSKILVSLKQKYPGIRLIIDYRDKLEDGFATLTKSQKKTESLQQENILKHTDLALTVNENISLHLKELFHGLKTYVLPHCVDTDFFDLTKKETKRSKSSNEIFIYGGELYNGLENEVKTFSNFFKKYRSESRNQISAEFYLPYPAYEHLLSDDSIKLSPIVSKDKYQAKMVESDFIMLFRPEWSPNAFSSKFFEILCLRKPILYFGKKGTVSDFLLNHRLGYHVTEQNIALVIERIKNQKTDTTIPDKNFDLSKFTFEYHTRLLIDKVLA